MFHRFTVHLESVTVDGSAVADSDEIGYGSYTSGMVVVGTGLTSLTWYAAVKAGGTYYPAYDYDGVAVVQTVVAGRAYPIPLALIGSRVIKAVGNTDGVIDVSLKS